VQTPPHPPLSPPGTDLSASVRKAVALVESVPTPEPVTSPMIQVAFVP
jgi:hypothetical protein